MRRSLHRRHERVGGWRESLRPLNLVFFLKWFYAKNKYRCGYQTGGWGHYILEGRNKVLQAATQAGYNESPCCYKEMETVRCCY